MEVSAAVALGRARHGFRILAQPYFRPSSGQAAIAPCDTIRVGWEWLMLVLCRWVARSTPWRAMVEIPARFVVRFGFCRRLQLSEP